ncbi:MAG: rhomboid family intramembrane serine protease [Marinovum sp.]|nr:rhomboid family intramembrane serine protease [Marinovum sp.]
MFPIRDHNPSNRVPYVTYALMAINIVVFVSYWHLLDNPRALNGFYIQYGFVPALLSEGVNIQAILTSMFLHGGWMHLAGNMLFLFIFGDNIEEELGHVGYLFFYILSGVAAALGQFAADPLSQVPMVGASGAIAGVMGAYLLLFPKAKVDILIILVIIFRIFPVPAWIMLGFWFALQLIGGVGSVGDGGGVAYWAHAAGFIAGLVFIIPAWLKEGGRAFWERTDGHPPHPEAKYRFAESSIPRAGRRR